MMNKGEKLAFFWDYYKWHTLAGLFVAVLISAGIYSASLSNQYGLFATYIGNAELDGYKIEMIKKLLADAFHNINAEDKKTVELHTINYSGDVQISQNFELIQKIDLEFSVGESYLYILSRGIFDMYKEEGLFEPLTGLSEQDNENISVSAKYTKLMALLGEEAANDSVICVRKLRNTDIKKEKAKKMHDYALGIVYGGEI